MPITVHNAEINTSTSADPSVYTLGFTPTAGRSLLVAVRIFSGPLAGVSDDGSNTWVQDFTVVDEEVHFYRVQSIGSVPTTLSFDQDGTVFTYAAVLEVSGLATSPVGNTVEETNTTAGTSHAQEYTIDDDGGLVFAWLEDSNDEWLGTSGTTELFRDSSEARGAFYKTVATAETADYNFTSTSSRSVNTLAHITYEADQGGGGFQAAWVKNSNQVIG